MGGALGEPDSFGGQLAVTLDRISDGFLALDRQWRFVHVNAAAERFLGMTRAQMLGKVVWELFPGSKETPAGKLVMRAAAGTVPVEIESRSRLGNRPVLQTVYPSASGVTVYFRDLSEQELAADALRESEEKYRSLVDHSLLAVLLTTPSGETLAANPAACRMLQRTEEELCRLGREGIADPEDSRWAEFLEERNRDGFARREVTLLRKDGAKVPVEASSVVFTDRHGQLRTSLSLVDLTERKRAERATRLITDATAAVSASLERPEILRMLTSLVVPRLADVCVIDIDEGGGLQRAAIEQRAGLRDWPSGTRASVGASRVFRSGQPEVITSVTDDDDGLRTLGVRSALRVPLVLGGKPTGVLSLLILDESRAFVADDVPTAAALADRAALALDNARLYQEAREANRGRDDVLKMVSHDLRNSLNAIGFIATELARQGGSPLATQIRTAATLADRLLGDMGALLVIESGALVLGRVMESVDSIIKEVADLFRPLADARAIELRAVTEPAGLTAFVDRHRMVQAVSNVVANAVEISQEGGRVDMAVKRVGDEVVFAVSDSGPGIAPAELDQVFSKGRLGNDGRRRASVGLGLVISKEYVEAHGGRIRVENQPGSGSTFTIAIPIRPHEPPPDPRPARGAQSPSR
jgi:PAS domain S-box-containing protein